VLHESLSWCILLQHSFQQHRGHPQQSSTTYKEPKAIEVWTLGASHLNAAIPADIRSQFHTDAAGNVLFFTAPPAPVAEPDKKKLTHSPAYLAFRARQQQEKTAQANKRPSEPEAAATVGAEKDGSETKRARTMDTNVVRSLQDEVLVHINGLLVNATVEEFKELYGEQWSTALDLHLKLMAEAQTVTAARLEEGEKYAKLKDAREMVGERGLTSLLEYQPVNEGLEWRR